MDGPELGKNGNDKFTTHSNKSNRNNNPMSDDGNPKRKKTRRRDRTKKKKKKQRHNAQQQHEVLPEDIPSLLTLFEKKFEFDTSMCMLPNDPLSFFPKQSSEPANNPSYTTFDDDDDEEKDATPLIDPRMLELKKTLNTTRAKLASQDLELWGEHTAWTNRAGNVVPHLRLDIGAELCTVAWAKMYEILSTYRNELMIPAIIGIGRARPDESDDNNNNSNNNNEQQQPPPSQQQSSRTIFNTVHLCEAPGAFVCATNHFIKYHYYHYYYCHHHHQQQPQQTKDQNGTTTTTTITTTTTTTMPLAPAWEWFASTLNPYCEGNSLREMIDQDWFIAKTLPRWEFCADNTGNIMNADNVRSLWSRARKQMAHSDSMYTCACVGDDGNGVVSLVTADGGIDCHDNPREQEAMTASLIYCEVVCALGMLARGGSFVLKMFTMFEHSSVSLLYLLGCVFDRLHVFKPATSKAGNSERYVICTGFKGIPPQHLEALLARVGPRVFFDDDNNNNSSTPRPMLPRRGIPDAFFDQVVECAKRFVEYQCETIKDNLRLFPIAYESLAEQQRIEAQKTWVAREWFRRCAILPISPKDQLMQEEEEEEEEEAAEAATATAAGESAHSSKQHE